MNKFAGIDFGTTNTSIGYIENKGKAKLIGLLDGSTTDRTSIFYSFDEDGTGIVGQNGFDDSILGQRGRLITSPKKFLKNNEMPEIQILRDKFDLTDIISHIIIHFKQKLESEVGEEIDSILVGRPVRFHDTSDELDKLAENRLKVAFLKAGFKNIEFQLEPIGAFNAYKNNHLELNESNNKILVVDLGGGTSDFSLIETSRNGINILGNTGVYVGGDNIDERLILNHFGNYLGKGAKQKLINGGEIEIPQHIFINFSDKARLIFFNEYESTVKGLLPLLVSNEDKISLSRLYEVFGDISKGYDFHSIIEEIKIGLTKNNEIITDFNMFERKFQASLNNKQFNEIIDKELNKIRLSLLELLNITGLKGDNIDKIIMNGGTSYIPIIKTIVENIIGKGKILEGNTLSSVGYGLTLESYYRFR